MAKAEHSGVTLGGAILTGANRFRRPAEPPERVFYDACRVILCRREGVVVLQCRSLARRKLFCSRRLQYVVSIPS